MEERRDEQYASIGFVCVLSAADVVWNDPSCGRSELSLMRQQRCLVTREMIYYFTFAGDFVFEERLEEVSGY